MFQSIVCSWNDEKEGKRVLINTRVFPPMLNSVQSTCAEVNRVEPSQLICFYSHTHSHMSHDEPTYCHAFLHNKNESCAPDLLAPLHRKSISKCMQQPVSREFQIVTHPRKWKLHQGTDWDRNTGNKDSCNHTAPLSCVQAVVSGRPRTRILNSRSAIVTFPEVSFYLSMQTHTCN